MSFTPLSEEPDFSFPSGTSDLRGWEIRTMMDGEKVGEVEDLLVDESGTIRYLDVDVATARKHVLVPTSRARIDEVEQVVWVPGLNRSQLEGVPAYDHDPSVLTPEYEARLESIFRDYATPPRPAAGRTDTAAGGRASGYQAGITRRAPAATTSSGRLAALATMSEFEVAPGEIDPRGWDLILGDWRLAGTVHDLIFDTDALRVRYLDCELTLPGSGGRHILVPITAARLDTGEVAVFLDGVTTETLRDLPSFPGLPLAPEFEERVHQFFSRNAFREGR